MPPLLSPNKVQHLCTVKEDNVPREVKVAGGLRAGSRKEKMPPLGSHFCLGFGG